MNLLTVTPSWIDNGIFKYIQPWSPWRNSGTTATELNLDYYGNVSGDKCVSPLVGKLVAFNADRILTEAEHQSIAALIKARYKNDWDRLWKALQAEYNPLHNYDMTEVETPGVKTTQKYNTDKTDTSKTKEDVHTDNVMTSKVKALGSTTYSDLAQTDGDTDTTRANANNETEVHTVGDADDNFVTTEHEGENRIEKRGNLGVTTSQQMLSSEYEMRIKYNFFDYVYNCIDEIMTIPYFERRLDVK